MGNFYREDNGHLSSLPVNFSISRIINEKGSMALSPYVTELFQRIINERFWSSKHVVTVS
jgi:hypothetical protein